MTQTTYATDVGDLVIEFDYQPAESATLTYPGCPASVTVGSVMAGPFDILEWCSKPAIALFEENCWEQLQIESDRKESLA